MNPMKLDERKPIGHCANLKCNEPIWPDHDSPRCDKCSEPLPDSIIAQIPKVQWSKGHTFDHNNIGYLHGFCCGIAPIVALVTSVVNGFKGRSRRAFQALVLFIYGPFMLFLGIVVVPAAPYSENASFIDGLGTFIIFFCGPLLALGILRSLNWPEPRSIVSDATGRPAPPPNSAVAKKEEPRVCCWTCTQFEVSGWLDRTKGYCRRHQRKTFADLVCDNYEPKGQ